MERRNRESGTRNRVSGVPARADLKVGLYEDSYCEGRPEGRPLRKRSLA